MFVRINYIPNHADIRMQYVPMPQFHSQLYQLVYVSLRQIGSNRGAASKVVKRSTLVPNVCFSAKWLITLCNLYRTKRSGSVTSV